MEAIIKTEQLTGKLQIEDFSLFQILKLLLESLQFEDHFTLPPFTLLIVTNSVFVFFDHKISNNCTY